MRYYFKTLLLLTMAAVLSPSQAQQLDNAVILLYHHVSTTTPASTSISPAMFEQHMQLLQQHYKVLPLTEIITKLQQGQTLPDKAVAITFDDGHDNLFSQAHPILKSMGLPYTIFITPETVGRHSQLSWQQIKVMANDGVSFANHSLRHDHLLQKQANETEQQWLRRIQLDITQAEQMLQDQLGYSLKYLAYPYGEFNPQLQKLVTELGYIGFGQHSGAISSASDFSALPRFPAAGIYARLKSLKVKLNSLAMPVINNTLPSPEVAQDRIVDWQFEITTTDINPRQIGCFFEGDNLDVQVQDKTVSPQLLSPLPTGRSRVNCTAPSKQHKGRYYWFSQPFFRAGLDGIWRN